MKRLLLPFSLLSLALALSACQFYFLDDDDEPCDPAYETCIDNPPPLDGECTSDFDCTTACYCAGDGICTPSDFCYDDWDCANGMVCDYARETCVPEEDGFCYGDWDCRYGDVCDVNGLCVEAPQCCNPGDACPANDPPCNECLVDTDCDTGEVCDGSGACVPAACTADGDCDQGSYCDETVGQCVVTSSCDINTPDCADPSNICDPARNTCVPPAEIDCDDYDSSGSQCLSVDMCNASYTGINCTDPNGLPCTEGSANCTCESFYFADCINP